MQDNSWLDVLGLFALIFIPLFSVQYFLVIKPAKKRIDIWLKQQEDKNKGKQ